jgi:hypothetical protein
LERIPRLLLVLLAVLALLSWRQWSRRDIVHPPGALVSQQPVQTAIEPGPAMTQGEFQLQRRAQFEVQARVLSTERYYWGREADLSPVDLALGWGPMSDQAMLDRISITQGNRWYFTSYDLPAPLPPADVVRNSSNMHMIPAEPWIEDELLALRRGDVVQLQGYLVDVQDAAGFTWRTSLTREDTGAGSCELLWVTNIQRAARP